MIRTTSGLGRLPAVSPQALSLTLSLKGEGTVRATANHGFSRLTCCTGLTTRTVSYRAARIAPSPFGAGCVARAGGEGSPRLDASPFASKLAPTKTTFALEVQS
jgi:hypothetical protein